ncbi:uncharacterized protein LOC135098959 isoform X7 [Scylla paramamosain]|uniref:uncharacterized protein LOC135098959 isoform X7 n=1 Tax=Scylla paramamosain TaxID=85552 RepID=UPI003082A3E1
MQCLASHLCEATSEVPVVGSPVPEYEVEEEEEEEDEEEARMRKKKRSLAVALPPADKGILMRPSYRYSPSRVTADDDDATPTPSLSHPPPTPALTKPPPVTTTTTTTSDVTPHPTPPQTTGKVTGKACEVSQNELVKLSGLFKYHWNCSSEEEEEVRECAKTLYSGAKEWREMRRNLKENRSRMTSDSRSP